MRYVESKSTKHFANPVAHAIVASNLQASQPKVWMDRFSLTMTSAVIAALFAGCSSRPLPPRTPPAAPPAAPQPQATPNTTHQLPLTASWADYRRRAAQLILQGNPGASFTGPQPVQWNGIATVTVMLNADGSIRGMDLMRGSKVSPHVNNLALQAAQRVGNYGPVGNLPQPWQFNETFLYNDANKFQLITIIENR